MRSLKRTSLVPLLSLLICFAAAPTIAQDLDNVTISGKVADQNGAVIPGATVTATLVKTKAERAVVTDDEGRYKIIQLEPGVYNLKASAVSFQPHILTDLAFIAAQNAQIDLMLFPPGINVDPVVVTTEDISPVDTTR